MRNVAVVALLMVVWAGCISPVQEEPLTSVTAHDGYAAVDEAFYQEIQDNPASDWEIQGRPYLVAVDGFEGPADYEAVRDVVNPWPAEPDNGTAAEGFWLPDHVWLSFQLIGPTIVPAWGQDGDADGLLRSWDFDYMVNWDPGRWAVWSTSWINGSEVGYGATTSSNPERDPRHCGDTDIATWAIGSDEAFSIALEETRFADHFAAMSDGEAWFRFTFGDSHETDCATPWEPTWKIRWMDSDQLLSGGAHWVEVTLDATTGAVESVHEGHLKNPRDYAFETIAQGQIPRVVGEPVTFDLAEGEAMVTVFVEPDDLAPIGVGVGDADDVFTLLDPSGEVVEKTFDRLDYWSLQRPMAGTWTITYEATLGAHTTHYEHAYQVDALR